MNSKVVICSDELGVYLGSFMGLGFWSKLDPAGQNFAVCFDDKGDAQSHVNSWDEIPCSDIEFILVETSQEGWATMDECNNSGIDKWRSDFENLNCKNSLVH